MAGIAVLSAAVAGRLGAQSDAAPTPPPGVPAFEELLKLRQFAEVALSPDGSWAAYVTAAPFRLSRAPAAGSITLISLRGATSCSIAVGGGAPRGLRWSPRGETLAFLAPLDGETRVWYSAPCDSVAQPLPARDSLGGGVLAFAWSPTGTSIAYLAAEADPNAPGNDSTAPAPRIVLFRDAPGDFTGPTSPGYRRDSAGAYLATAALNADTAEVLARHVVSAQAGPTLDWSSTGELLISGAPIGVSWWTMITTRQLDTFDPRARAMRRVQEGKLERRSPRWSPSGRRIGYMGYRVYPENSRRLEFFALQVEEPRRPGEALRLSRENDGFSWAHAPVWGDDSTIYIVRSERATARLFAVDLASRRWRALTPDTLSVSDFAVARDGRTMVAVLENANTPEDLYRVDPASGKLTRLTHGAGAVPDMPLGRVEQVAWPSRDGRFTVHGFLVKPPGFDSTRRYPLIVLVHGGPGALYTNSFVSVNFSQQGYPPPQWFAAAGYLVLLPNPRGDGSYGEAFAAALHEDWGPGPFSDVDAGVSALVARGLADSTRLGIWGGSYGGYLTAFGITQTRRFAAASIDDGPTDLRTDYGLNYAFHSDWFKAVLGGTPWERPAVYARQSPITYVDRVRTPVLMRYGGRSSTRDHVRLSYLLPQGLELYAGLRDAGVPVEFVLHPDQGHGAVDWELYTDLVRRNLDWYDYWLRHQGTDPTAERR
jgi:dipeptidyl aminopeptidase/acylaminoacyl peptidase